MGTLPAQTNLGQQVAVFAVERSDYCIRVSDRSQLQRYLVPRLLDVKTLNIQGGIGVMVHFGSNASGWNPAIIIETLHSSFFCQR